MAHSPRVAVWGLNGILLGAWLVTTALGVAVAVHLPRVRPAPSLLRNVAPDRPLPSALLSVAAPEGLWRIGERGVQLVAPDLSVTSFPDEAEASGEVTAKYAEQVAWDHERLAVVRGGRLFIYSPDWSAGREVLRDDLKAGRLGPLDLRAPLCPTEQSTSSGIALQ